MPVPNTQSSSLARVVTYAFAVQLRARAAAGDEFLSPHRVYDDPMFVVQSSHDANGYAVRDALQVVQGTVQWVYDPCVRVAGLFAGFFRQNSMIWVGFTYVFDDNRLGGAIDVGHKVVAALFLDFN